MIIKHIILLLFLIPRYGFAEENIQQNVQNILNDKTINDPYERWKTANDTVTNHIPHLSSEETIHLYHDILLPFIEKNVKDNRKHTLAKSSVYEKIIVLYEEMGFPEDDANMEAFYHKAVEFAEQCRDDTIQARLYNDYGIFQSIMGNIPLAHEYYYKALAIFETLNDFDYIFKCLFEIAENLLVTRDVAGLRKVVEQMQRYTEMPTFGGNPYCLYNFYSVQTAYYNTLSEDNPEIAAYKDTLLQVSRKTIHVSKMMQERGASDAFGFAYYNMAYVYRECYPQRYDSIYYFLEAALDLKVGSKQMDTELEICVFILYAELHFEQKRYKEAEKDMLYALSLLEQVTDDNTTPEYAEACKFLVMYYETMNRPYEALKYHKLLLENEKKRYDNDKIVAMNNMLVKYETEKKQVHIEWLTERNKNARKILILTLCLIVLLSIVLLALIRLIKLRKKNFEISIYEAALVSELKQNELEQNLKEKEQLEIQYQKLKTQSDRNIQKSQLYDAKLKQIERQLEQKPTKTIIGKLIGLITGSYMEKTKKNAYIRQLSELDIEMIELGYHTANEKISNMDMKYIICFAIDMDVKDMSDIFDVEPTTVRTVRYRIKKKFGNKNTFKFLM